MRRHSAFAAEGFWPFTACAAFALLLAKFAGPAWALTMLIPMGLLLALFKDAQRQHGNVALRVLEQGQQQAHR
ncbi:MAG: hypothetical protein AAFR09_03495, partial [Pseudomonadota bacterium]